MKTKNYFTILTLSIYTVKRNWAESPKSSRWNSQKKAQLTVLCRDLKLMSRHEFPLFAPVQSRPCCFCCNQISCSMLGSMVATSFVVATLFAQCFSRVDVVTTVSCRDIIVFLFFWLLSCDNSLGCDHLSVCMMTLGHNFLFLVAIVLVVFCLHMFQFYVATSFDVQFSSSGRNFNSLLQPVSSFEPLFQVATSRCCRDLMLLFFWLHVVPFTQK